MKRAAVAVTKRRRTHRSLAEWRALIGVQERSGLSQKAFCRAEGVSTASLANWRKRLRTEGGPVADATAPGFVEIAQIARPLDGGIRVRLELGAGVVLELSKG